MPTTLAFHAGRYAGGLRQSPHRHDELHLSLVLQGRIAETVGGSTEYAGALSVVAKDPGVVHADLFGPRGATVARLSLPDGGIADLVEDPGRAFAWRWAHDLAVAVPFLRLVRRASARDVTFASTDDDVVELLAALTARRTATPRGAPPAWLAETLDRMRAEWRPGLRVTDVAEDAGVHPVYLARCVRRWYGTSLAGLMREQRLRRAAQAIGDAPERVSMIAHGSGYADEAHLCRDFRHATGTTPGAFRALVRAAGTMRRAG